MDAELRFLESYSIDDTHYFVLEGRAGRRYELTWQRARGRKRWRIGRRTADPRAITRRPVSLIQRDVSRALVLLGIDLTEARATLRSAALQQLAHADLVIAEGRRLLGPQVLREAQTWRRSLETTVGSLVAHTLGTRKRAPHLSLVRGPAEDDPV